MSYRASDNPVVNVFSWQKVLFQGRELPAVQGWAVVIVIVLIETILAGRHYAKKSVKTRSLKLVYNQVLT